MSELWPIIIGLVVVIAVYIAVKVYISHVSDKYRYDIANSWARFIPMAAWVIVVVMEVSENGNIPLEIVIVSVAAVIYGLILYSKTKNIKDTILVSVLQTAIAFVLVVIFFCKIILSFIPGYEGGSTKKTYSNGNASMYQYDNRDAQNKKPENTNKVDWQEEERMAMEAEAYEEEKKRRKMTW